MKAKVNRKRKKYATLAKRSHPDLRPASAPHAYSRVMV